jgi:hypothetical protein
MAPKIKLGEMLLQAGVLTQSQLNDALKSQLIYGGKLGTNLVELGFVEVDALTGVLSRQTLLPPVQAIELVDIPVAVIGLLQPDVADRHRAIPFREDDRSVHVAVVDATNLAITDMLRFATGRDVRVHIAPEVLIARALNTYYGIPNKERYIRLSDDPLFIERADQSQPALWPELKPERPARTNLGDAVRRLLEVSNTNAVLEVMLDFGAPFFRAVAVLANRGEQFEVIGVRGTDSVRRRLLGARTSVEKGALIQQVVQLRRTHVAPMPLDHEDSSLLEKFEEDDITMPVLASPMIVQERVELIMLGVGMSSQFNVGQIRRFEMLLEKASLATQILRLTNRLAVLPEELT